MSPAPPIGGSVRPAVRRMRAEESGELVAVAARAFWHDPLFDHFARDLRHEYELLPRMFDIYMKDLEAPQAEVWVAEHEGRARAIAGWLAPGAFPRPAARELARTLRALRALPRAHRPLLAARLLLAVERRHPHEPHWYLALLATDPKARGRGLASELMAPMLARADEAGVPAYLETQKRENVSWYARFGFAVAETVELTDAPPVWCLRREPTARA